MVTDDDLPNWSDFWLARGNSAASHDYDAFMLAKEYAKHALESFAARRAAVPEGMSLVPKKFVDTVRAASQPFTHPKAVPVLIQEAMAMLAAAPEVTPR